MTFTPDVETAARLRFLDDVLVGKRDSCARKRPLCKIKALSHKRAKDLGARASHYQRVAGTSRFRSSNQCWTTTMCGSAED